jgi:hypothetical protein
VFVLVSVCFTSSVIPGKDFMLFQHPFYFLIAGLILCVLASPEICPAFPMADQDKSNTNKEQPAKNTGIAEPGKLPPFEVPNLEVAPAIDGELDDAAWNMKPLAVRDWLTYSPTYGDTLAQKTDVWMGHDKNYLYLAFRCLDPEPRKIKTSIARRDTIWNDDWVGLSLDALGTGQSSYDLFSNPNGIQGDILNSSTAGEDSAPDWVWDSAGRSTAEGYQVEMRIPLKSIRFKSGTEVRMGVLFWRRVSRLGMSASWPDLPRGKSIFTRYAPVLIRDIQKPLTLEAMPNITYALQQIRTSSGWGKMESKPDAGITVKYGITSAVTLDGTYRPDFSQVESDAFQVEVNQRYPVFYSEKRPFFMEGMGSFELAGAGGDGNMRTAVHTRRIIDPLYGVKLTGSPGKFTFATLSASDRAPGQTNGLDPHFGEREEYNIARTLYSVGKGGYVGALFTDSEFGGGHNRVVASDLKLQLGEHQQLSATAIASDTLAVDAGPVKKGMAAQMHYSYESKRYELAGQLEHYDRDFQMDTAFYKRTGITGGWAYSGINLYPGAERSKWLKRINPFFFFRGYQDRIQGGSDQIYVGGLRFSFTRQGTFGLNLVTGQEPWAGRMFDIRGVEMSGGAQLYGWLNIQSYLSLYRSIYYDPENPFPGNDKYVSVRLTLQPSSRLNQKISVTRDVFDHLDGGPRVYAVNIVNSRTSYQISKRFAVRAIAQFDSSRCRVLTDFLGSYELVPGTVAYAGYGSLFEQRSWDGEQWRPGSGNYLITQRGLFFKVSYLYRF